MDPAATALTVALVVVVVSAVFACSVMSVQIGDLKREVAKHKVKAWHVENRTEKWGTRDEDGKVRNAKPGMAVYVSRGEYGGGLPMGHVKHDEEDFMDQLSELRVKGEERASDLNAMEGITV